MTEKSILSKLLSEFGMVEAEGSGDKGKSFPSRYGELTVALAVCPRYGRESAGEIRNKGGTASALVLRDRERIFLD